jgi:hypothetical protein
MLMSRTFIHTKMFDKKWADMGCDDDDLGVLQKTICENLQKHPVIRGTGGVRKVRIALEGRGKSGGVRVLYVDFLVDGVIGLLFAYPKNEKEDITEAERKILKDMVTQIRKNRRVGI